ncbi:exosortase family protein XrtF [Pseudochryseolinea flava]|uniref:Exosortase family protein XrtF n=1 Tax=Pseudochryseolinea flava TaxID=2059302 RepID=A0A364Y4N3_9BACT|nr:exosortase family protein XrtF [Pseudochryseolinea flava]RAW01284.1 exosortase family protein XrtF [Pseudochryseolinea flava]
MAAFHWKDFKPTIFFIGKFLGVYLLGNLLYGTFITTYHPAADPITVFVTNQTTAIIDVIASPVSCYPSSTSPSVVIRQDRPIVSVFEGCNGFNVMIVFLAFTVAIGEFNRKMWWFVPGGILLIHAINLFRIGLLFFISRDYPHNLYFFHKYLLTALVYGAIFLLWFIWLRVNKKLKHEPN